MQISSIFANVNLTFKSSQFIFIFLSQLVVYNLYQTDKLWNEILINL